MKKLHLRILIATFAVVTAQSAVAAPGIGFVPSDIVKTVLDRQIGQQVELRLKSGEKIAGKIERVGEKAVYITAITGEELFEALVILDDVSAVLVRSVVK